MSEGRIGREDTVQVYVHGLGQTPAAWENTISRMRGGVQSVCPDLPGLLRGKEADYGNLYQAFSAVCAQIQEPINLCGLSLGGVIALNYAIDHPTKVHSLAVIAAQYKMPKKLLRLQNAVFRLMPRSKFRDLGFDKGDFICLCRTMMDLDFSGSLQKISCPVLVICGEQDKANEKASAELAAGLKNAEIQVIPEAGHQVNLEAPERLAELLQTFYDNVS